jgi:methionyl-tRNA formyltransferase
MEGESETGVTIMYMEKGLDTGDMLSKCATVITDEDNAESLHDRLSEMGANLLVQTLDILNEITPVKQDDAAHTYAPMLTKADCHIDFTLSAREVFNQIRGLSPFPGAYTMLAGKVLKVYASAVVAGHGAPATVIDGEGLTVACGEGAVRLTMIKPEGKKSMTDSQYLNGHPIEKGVVLE